MDEPALAALFAVVAIAAEPADRHPVAHREPFHAVTEFVDGARDFVAEGQRPRHAGEVAVDELAVGAADTARAHRDADMSGWGRGGLDIDELERAVSRVDVYRTMHAHVWPPVVG